MFPAYSSYNSQPTMMWLPVQLIYHYPLVTMEDFDVFDTDDGRLWVYKRRPYHSSLHYNAYAPEHQSIEVPFEDIAMPTHLYPTEWVQTFVDEIEAAMPIQGPQGQQLQEPLLWTPPQCQAGDPVGTAEYTMRSSPFLSAMSNTIEESWGVESQHSPFQDQRLNEIPPPVQGNNYTDAGPIQTPLGSVERQHGGYDVSILFVAFSDIFQQLFLGVIVDVPEESNENKAYG
ncbi:hypothetical protein CVT24_013197 [Panaeolus cyanescens]|uniref:Uncharacterized protein n=1 Tax=Panaeolus cyanescens TaxID=181874 RepID=A0A409YMP7_9AGAR|nr:hypothetical protein CVT24_013197 [Panaeolus cyanescens]